MKILKTTKLYIIKWLKCWILSDFRKSQHVPRSPSVWAGGQCSPREASSAEAEASQLPPYKQGKGCHPGKVWMTSASTKCFSQPLAQRAGIGRDPQDWQRPCSLGYKSEDFCRKEPRVESSTLVLSKDKKASVTKEETRLASGHGEMLSLAANQSNGSWKDNEIAFFPN